MYENTVVPTVVGAAVLAKTGHTMGLSAVQMLMLYLGLAIVVTSISILIRRRK
jgi:hypothetical protein